MRVTKKGLMILVLLGLASGVGRIAGSYWVAGPAGNEAAASAPLIEPWVSGIPALASAAELIQGASEAPALAGYVDEASAKCLECHGPFAELMAKPGNFAITNWQGESKINPHRYVEHKSKDVPACVNCHVVHPVPPASTPEKPKSIKWCYDVCHHQQDFTPCSTCHEGR